MSCFKIHSQFQKKHSNFPKIIQISKDDTFKNVQKIQKCSRFSQKYSIIKINFLHFYKLIKKNYNTVSLKCHLLQCHSLESLHGLVNELAELGVPCAKHCQFDTERLVQELASYSAPGTHIGARVRALHTSLLTCRPAGPTDGSLVIFFSLGLFQLHICEMAYFTILK